MTQHPTHSGSNQAVFDPVAGDYEAQLGRGIRLSGYGQSFFASQRVIISARVLQRLGITPDTTLDFGCGNGATTPHIIHHLHPRRHIGVDISESLLAEAKREHAQPAVEFQNTILHTETGHVDVVYSNGVFHHIVPRDRPAAHQWIHDVLKPGGVFLFWENNAWSLPARIIMSRIPFDRDARPLSILAAAGGMRAAGLQILLYRFEFIFPRALSFLRPLERLFRWIPAGSQYLIVGRR